MFCSVSGARRAAGLAMLALVTTACASSSASPTPAAAPKPAAAPTPNPTAVAEGMALVTSKGCGGCHVIPGVAGATGTVGPNLAGVATRTSIAGGAVPNNGPDDLKRWILDPPAAKPGTQMPNLGLSDDEATKITALLQTLR